ncbi:NAD(+) synthase [Parabacteroides sp. PF5-6]|uniref:NAD(+) synthase n=1 Tax=Parabacteroides sp. PF5-6 TaxID=1742403 RepID=UPI00240666B0|nr:NAD(+) synthase [Parabacteroides sp. PF5-6]MDF9829008.1 NAD+ synthase (glutamine-hydrolyzing) [Parabacteroides sp. PF5-6]
MNNGFIKVAAATPRVRVADCEYNKRQIEDMIRRASAEGVQLIVFPELALTGYSCQDLFSQQTLLNEAETQLVNLYIDTNDLPILVFVGVPLQADGVVVNACVAFQQGKVLGVVPKTYLPNYKEFQEKRWFTSAHELKQTTIPVCTEPIPMSPSLLFTCGGTRVGVELCEDLWMPSPPSSRLAMAGAQIIVNPSASNELAGKHSYRKQLVSQQSARCISAYLYAATGYGESTTDLVFAGGSLIAENGTILAEAPRFSMEEQLIITEIDIEYLMHDRRLNTNFTEGLKAYKDKDFTDIRFFQTLPKKDTPFFRTINPYPFIPSGEALDERCEEIFRIQIAGLAKRLEHTHCQTAVIGISGGLDSTLALLVTAMTFDALQIPRRQIIGVTMPGFGTSDRTYTNAIELMKSLDVTLREIPIREAVLQHFKDISHNPDQHDVTYENAQARERTQILMDIANQQGGMVIGTGDLSELALGWATYNGDHMSMYGLNAGIPKTLIKYLVKWIAQHKVNDSSRHTLLDIVDTPISPELIPSGTNGEICQRTEDLVGPYELHDFFLYHFLRHGAHPAKIFNLTRLAFGEQYEEKEIVKWMHTFFRRFFQQQFKRNCLPDGPKVGSISLSPRGDWRMPSDTAATVWLDAVEYLESLLDEEF